MLGQLASKQDYVLWTPVFTFATPGNLATVYSQQRGFALRDGKLVHADFRMDLTTFTHTTAAGNAQITGLPWTSTTATGYIASGKLAWTGITKANYTEIALRLFDTATLLELLASGSGQALSTVVPADMPTAGTVTLRGSITYRID